MANKTSYVPLFRMAGVEPPKSHNDMVVNFVMTLTHRRPDKLKEIEDIMKPESSLVDMFSFLWGLEEAHVKLTPPIVPSKKSDENSFIYWRLGTTHLNRKDKDMALKYFNLSILLAPHPDFIIDDKVIKSNVEEKDRSEQYKLGEVGFHNREGWGQYVSLSYAYEARACLLLDMKQYIMCLRDIQFVLELGCPPVIKTKLNHMKRICEEKLECTKEEASLSASLSKKASVSPKKEPAGASPGRKVPDKEQISFKFISPTPPAVVDKNPLLPAFSGSVKLAYSKEEGRYLVADKTIFQGEVVAVEEAYCTTLRAEFLKVYCAVCAKRTLTPLPCPACAMVVFCSQHCRVQGLADVHWQECPLLATLVQLDLGASPLLALRMFLKKGHLKLREIVPKVMAESRSQQEETRGFDTDGVYDHTNYRTVYNLVTNKGKRGYKDLLNNVMEAFSVLKMLQKGGKYFRDSEGKSFEPSEEDLIFTGSLLMHHMMNFGCNAQGLLEVMIIGKEADKNPLRVYGAGVFPATSLMSHSCYPSCVVLTYGRFRVVKANRIIPAGERVTCPYIDAIQSSIAERRARLFPQYFFVCRCEACEKNWPDGLQFTTAYNLKCVRCRVLVNPNTKKCSQCNLYYTKRAAVSGSSNLFTYEYNTVKKKVDQALKEYKRAQQRLIKKGNESESDIRIVSNLIELYDTYVELPAYMHYAAQTIYMFMSYINSSSAHCSDDVNPQCNIS